MEKQNNPSRRVPLRRLLGFFSVRFLGFRIIENMAITSPDDEAALLCIIVLYFRLFTGRKFYCKQGGKEFEYSFGA